MSGNNLIDRRGWLGMLSASVVIMTPNRLCAYQTTPTDNDIISAILKDFSSFTDIMSKFSDTMLKIMSDGNTLQTKIKRREVADVVDSINTIITSQLVHQNATLGLVISESPLSDLNICQYPLDLAELSMLDEETHRNADHLQPLVLKLPGDTAEIGEQLVGLLQGRAQILNQFLGAAKNRELTCPEMTAFSTRYRALANQTRRLRRLLAQYRNQLLATS